MEEGFGLGVEPDCTYDVAIVRTRVELNAHGFGVLSEMPIPASLGGQGRQHVFMCVWNRVISETNLGGQGLDVGDHLPMNVAVFEEEGRAFVAALDPAEGIEGPEATTEVAMAGREAITKALDAIAESTLHET